MGRNDTQAGTDEAGRRAFMKALLNELRALERMLDGSLFETGIRRIGAEQEMFLVDSACRPAPIAMEVLQRVGDDDRFTYELGQFNLEANLTPLTLGGDCLSRTEAEVAEVVARAREAARDCGGEVLLTGILPTLGQSDLGLDNMTPIPRYHALNDALMRLRDGDFKLGIKGIDQLDIRHSNIMLEAANTSFQVHFQVDPDEFARLYNMAQAITAPLLAAAVNSPLLLGRRLWQETRIAVFEHSIDARSDAHQARGLKPRVHFGDHWIRENAAEIFREDIARFRVVLTTDVEDDPDALIDSGTPPQLHALTLHNGTVYRWNRACYGVFDGKAHLRIENRVLPSGPTVRDEVANAAFFFGMLSGLAGELDDVAEHMSFADCKTNFFAAARLGLKAQFTWLDGEHQPAVELIRDQLLPLAERGLDKAGIDRQDIERYLGVVGARVEQRKTGARWMLDSLENLDDSAKPDECARALTAGMLKRQLEGSPVHEWDLVETPAAHDWRESYRTVGQFMSTDLFTVRPDDVVDFAASLMDWKHLRHVPVEDDSGRLVGLVSHRGLLRMVARGHREGRPDESVPVREIMIEDPTTVTPDTPTLEAIRLMRDRRLGCLPVVREGKLVGLVTERDLIDVSSRLLEQQLSGE